MDQCVVGFQDVYMHIYYANKACVTRDMSTRVLYVSRGMFAVKCNSILDKKIGEYIVYLLFSARLFCRYFTIYAYLHESHTGSAYVFDVLLNPLNASHCTRV